MQNEERVTSLKKEECNFYENARKYKCFLYILTSIFYTLCIASLIVFILNKLEVIILEKSDAALISGGNSYLFASFIFLCYSIFLTLSLCSKYYKYFMFITDNEIIFYDNKAVHNYNIKELRCYLAETKVLKKFGGREYCYYTLHFNDESYTITSFKPRELKAYLDKINIPNITPKK